MDIVLKATNISKAYGIGKRKVEALKKCSLELKKGEFVAITGRSGSGKTTLLKILGALEIADSGSLELEGKQILHLSDRNLSKIRRQKIGFIYQDYCLFPEFTAYENIVMPIHLDGRKENHKQIMELMETFGILYCKDKFPTELSGGEQQRIAIARAMAASPIIIFADEPTGNLDAENAEEIVMLMRRAADLYHQTIVMVTHDRQMADYADRIIYIKNGELVDTF